MGDCNRGRDGEDVVDQSNSHYTPSEVFGLLTDKDRRLCLHYLGEQPDSVANMDELVEYIQFHTGMRNPDTVAAEFHHRHRPKLIDVAVIEFDERTETIRYYSDPLVEKCLSIIVDWDLGDEV